jgi:hypothetical protein
MAADLSVPCKDPKSTSSKEKELALLVQRLCAVIDLVRRSLLRVLTTCEEGFWKAPSRTQGRSQD